MTEVRFVELVNLYLDGELAPDEQAELRQAIRSDAGCRTEFLAYVRVNRAAEIALLGEATRSASESEGIIPFPSEDGVAMGPVLAKRRVLILPALGSVAAILLLGLYFLPPAEIMNGDPTRSPAALSVAGTDPEFSTPVDPAPRGSSGLSRQDAPAFRPEVERRFHQAGLPSYSGVSQVSLPNAFYPYRRAVTESAYGSAGSLYNRVSAPISPASFSLSSGNDLGFERPESATAIPRSFGQPVRIEVGFPSWESENHTGEGPEAQDAP